MRNLKLVVEKSQQISVIFDWGAYDCVFWALLSSNQYKTYFNEKGIVHEPPGKQNHVERNVLQTGYGHLGHFEQSPEVVEFVLYEESAFT